MSDVELKELKLILERMQEEQVLSSFDSLLLLLLPLTTFLLGATSILWNLSQILAQASMTLAAVFAIVLIVLVFGKLRGSDMIRVFAWFLFFYFLGIFAVILSYTWILSFLVGEPVTLSPLYSLQFLFGVVLAGAGISYRPVIWTKRTMQRRLPMKAAEIERAYHQIWRETAASMRFPDAFLILAGLGAMSYSARMGVSGIPTYFLKPLDVLAGICIASCLVAIAWDLATRRKNGHR